MLSFLKFSITNVFRRKMIAILAIIGTLLGASLMTVLLSLSNGMEKRLNTTLDKVAGDITVLSQDSSSLSGFVGGGTPIPVSYIDEIKGLDHVKFVEGTVSTTVPKDSLNTLSPIGSPLQGISVEEDRNFDGPTVHITEGRMFNRTDEVIIGKTLKEQLTIAGNKITLGQVIQVPIKGKALETTSLPKSVKLQVATQSAALKTRTLTIVGFFDTGNDINDRNIVGDITMVRELTGLSSDQIQSIKVRADSSDNVEELAYIIKQKYKDSDKPVQTAIAKNLLGDINITLGIFREFLLVISAVSAVAGGMSIFIIMLMSVTERMQEFGILKAAGWSNTNLLFSVLLESISLSLIGALVGFGIGFGVDQIINQKIGESISIITLPLFLGVIAFGVVMGILGGIYPALRASKVSPMETLRSL